MPSLFSQDKLFRYLVVLACLICVAVLVMKIFFSPSEEESVILYQPQAKIKIDWVKIISPLKVVLPSLDIGLEALPSQTIENGKISLLATVRGVVRGPFSFAFDCQGDGDPELTAENVFSNSFLAENICSFTQLGVYRPQVVVKSNFNYFQDGQEASEEKSAIQQTVVDVLDSNSPPIIEFCDVSSIEGTTQTDFLFNFSTKAIDPEEGLLTYLWEFGDGNSSEQESPIYIYKKAGFYFPKLTVFDSQGAKAICLLDSLLFLGKLTPFERILFPPTIGRNNPFKEVAENEQSLIILDQEQIISPVAPSPVPPALPESQENESEETDNEE